MESLDLKEIKKMVKPLLKQIWYIEYKLMSIEYRLKKNPRALRNLLTLSKQLRPFFKDTSTQKLMDELRGKDLYGR